MLTPLEPQLVEIMLDPLDAPVAMVKLGMSIDAANAKKK